MSMYNERKTTANTADILKGIAMIFMLVFALFVSVKVFSADDGIVGSFVSGDPTMEVRQSENVYVTPTDPAGLENWNAVESPDVQLHPVLKLSSSTRIPYTTSTCGVNWTYSDIMDSSGNIHCGDMIRLFPFSEDDDSEIEFIIGGEYTTFITRLFTTQVTAESNLRLQIYSDNTLVYDTDFVDCDFNGDSIEIDVTDVNVLKFKCSRTGYVSKMDQYPQFCMEDNRLRM